MQDDTQRGTTNSKTRDPRLIGRRTFLRGSLTVAATMALGPLARFAHAATESHLIYLSPLKSNGGLSSCQGEVWYVQDGEDMVVVTAHDAWRARAVDAGLTNTQVWVGDVGLWKRSDGAYKKLPSLRAQAARETDAVNQARALTRFGEKYSDEWATWGPRFKNGLADGSRVMLRYVPS